MAYGERGAWNAPVYEAREEDYDFDQYGQPLPLAPPPPRPASDTPDAVYHDDNALLDCWAAALLEIKVIPLLFAFSLSRDQLTRLRQFKHPELFAPLQQAPLSLSQKRESAPLSVSPSFLDFLISSTHTSRVDGTDQKWPKRPNPPQTIVNEKQLRFIPSKRTRNQSRFVSERRAQ